MKQAPDDLNSDTPDWFKDWRNKEFWHFKQKTEFKLDFNNKLTIVVLAGLVAAAIARLFF